MYRHRVTFEAPGRTQDTETGAISETWEPVFANVPAAIEFRSVREAVGGGQIQVTTLGTISIRWRPGLDARHRIVWSTADGDRIFNISGIVPDKQTNRTRVDIPVVELV